jgi:hypothetical protein
MDFSVFLVSISGEKLKVLSKFGILQTIPKRQIIKLFGEILTRETKNTITSDAKIYGNAMLKFPM